MHEPLTDEYRRMSFYLVGDFSLMNDRGHHLPHDLSALRYLAVVDVAVPVGLTGFIKFFAKNSPEGFGIYRVTSAGEVLPQCIVDECLITAASFLGFDPECINNIIIQMYGDTCLTPGLDHRTTFALAKIVFLFHKLFDLAFTESQVISTFMVCMLYAYVNGRLHSPNLHQAGQIH